MGRRLHVRVSLAVSGVSMYALGPNGYDSGMRPVLLLEINEVPLRVWKKYAANPRFPSIGRFLRESRLVETEVSDDGELSPWCTWPTFHRGLPKKEHGIHN